MKKRILSLFLAVITLLSLCAPAFASDNAGELVTMGVRPGRSRSVPTEPASDQPATAANSGSCGAKLTWSFNSSTGELTISGSGAMYNYTDGTQPWRSLNVRSVVIGKSVTSVGDWAFGNLPNLEDVSYYTNASLRSIGAMAFYNIGNGKYTFGGWYVPETVTSLSNGALSGIPTSSFIVTSGTSSANYFSVQNGVLYNKSKTTLLQYPPERDATSFSMPSSVTAVAAYGMLGAYYLKSIYLPAGLKTIGKESFYGNLALTSITIPSGVTSIGAGAFARCDSLIKITIESTSCKIYNTATASDPCYRRTLGTPGMTTVYARTGSTAQTFANKYGYTFQSTGGSTSGGSTTDPSKKNGLVTEGSYTYYYKNGVKQKGFVTDTATGKMYYCSSTDGHVYMNGWILINGVKKYAAQANGELFTGYCAIEGKNYYFSVNDAHLMKGGLVTGPGNKQYYVSASDGHAMKNGWARGQAVKGRTGYSYYYYLDSTGVVRVTRQYKTSTAVSSLRIPQPYEYDN